VQRWPSSFCIVQHGRSGLWPIQAEQSFERPCRQCDGRSKRTGRYAHLINRYATGLGALLLGFVISCSSTSLLRVRSSNLRRNYSFRMTPDQLIEPKNNSVLRGRLAKFLSLECFRNSKLENLHKCTHHPKPRGGSAVAGARTSPPRAGKAATVRAKLCKTGSRRLTVKLFECSGFDFREGHSWTES
jgi:hypothetical protein